MGILTGLHDGGRPGSHGFTLIETLTAMMVLIISILVILQLFSGSLRAVRLSEDYSRAIYHASEKMEEFLLRVESSESLNEGAFADGYSWRVQIREEDEADERAAMMPLHGLYRYRVEISWASGTKHKTYSIETLQYRKRVRE